MGNVVFWQKVLSQLGFYMFLGLLYRLLENVFADCCGLGAVSLLETGLSFHPKTKPSQLKHIEKQREIVWKSR